ncbi:BlaI/MecI/CopY family transcriptional regulator [Hymenobacter glacialis]|uniref:CopY family transcriptional repressor n=1 Tax=Hymenobacter glacialis TaxID=1908236 RepID=A0A1G1T244_9BACT|nr:BlaI/MecI/CopY family transcriptional regulator [Hymenobacter glacialis]OGX84949.1 CopY family transcriptional repressor [Hymenobacter glacialis]
MEELTKTEERIMQALWKLKKAFVKDIIEQLPDEPKPPYNTVSSVVRILERKAYVGFRAYGKTYEYFPLISKTEYRAASLKRMLTQYFDDSPTALVSFMVEETLSQREKQQLLDLLQDADNTSPKPDSDAK